MKKLVALVAVLACFAGPAHADRATTRMGLTQPTTSFGDVWGYKYNDTMRVIDSSSAVQGSSNTFTSTNTFTQPVYINYATAGQCAAYDSNKELVSQQCSSGGGGASSLAVRNNGVLISSPTSNLNFSSNFTVTLTGGSTAAIEVNSTSLALTTATLHNVHFTGAEHTKMQLEAAGTHSLLQAVSNCLWLGSDAGIGSNCAAGGVNNTAVGGGAMTTCNSDGNNNCHESSAFGVNSQAANIGGFENDSFGFDSLLNCTTCLDNAAFGAYAQRGLTWGGGNSAFGFSASTANQTGNDNCSFGFASLEKNTGSNSSAYGFSALGSQSTGPNAAFGFNAGSNITTGAFNNIFGNRSMQSATTANGNTCMGDASCFALVDGQENTITGDSAFESAQSVSNTTAYGSQALVNNNGGVNDAYGTLALAYDTTGSSNVAVGFRAGVGVDVNHSSAVTTGNQNTFLGYEAAPSTSAQLTSSIAIGYQSTVGSSFTATIGQWTGPNEVNLRVSSATFKNGLVITNGGVNAATMTLTSLTASKAVKTDSSKNLVTGTLLSTDIPTDVAYIDVANTFASSQTFASSTTFNQAIVQNGTAGTVGQVMVSQGNNRAPVWASTASVSAAGGSPGQLQYNSAGVAAGLPSYTVSGGSVTISTPTAILGTSDGSDAKPGYAGEYKSTNTTTGALLTSANTAYQVLALLLTPGDWDITGMGVWASNTETVSATNPYFDAWIVTNSASYTGSVLGDNYGENSVPTGITPSVNVAIPIPSFRVSLSANTTYYLNAASGTTFTSGSPKATGRISARRVTR